MKTLNRVFSVLLWTFASFALILGILGTISATELVRFATISDDSSFPTAPSGSLELAVRTSTAEIVKGDTVLVGAHSSQGSTLGEVIDITKSESGAVAVTLKAPNREVPDQWNYELGSTTYKHVIATPFVGKIYALAGNAMNPWVFGALAVLVSAALLIALRFIVFAKTAKDPDPWFKKLEPEPNTEEFEAFAFVFDEMARKEREAAEALAREKAARKAARKEARLERRGSRR